MKEKKEKFSFFVILYNKINDQQNGNLLKNWNVIVYFSTMFLRNTFRYPYDITTFLFF